MRNRQFLKIFTLLLAFIAAISLLPVPAMAAGSSGTSAGLAALAFGGGETGSPAYSMTPAFSRGVSQYTVTVPDHDGSLYIFAAPANSSDRTCAYRLSSSVASGSYLNSGEWRCLQNLAADPAEENYEIHVAENPIYGSSADAKYTVCVKRQATLKSLAVGDSALLSQFDPDTLHYTVGVDANAQTVPITAAAFSSDYSLTVNGAAAASGTKVDVRLSWKDGRMVIPVAVSYKGTISSAYTLTLVRMSKGTKPVIYADPQSAVYLDTASPSALTVGAVAEGTLSYQWFSSLSNSTQGGSEISGATGTSYTPKISSVSADKTVYYYCEVTNTASGGETTASGLAAITVKTDPTPAVTLVNSADNSTAKKTYQYNTDHAPITLKALATSRVNGGLWFYQWNSARSWDLPATQTYTPSTTSDGQKNYTCTVTYYINGCTYIKESGSVTVSVTATSAKTPSITAPPAGQSYLLGGSDEVTALSVSADAPDGGKLSYQWYSSPTNSTKGGSAIQAATAIKYTPKKYTAANTTYYYCKVTNTVNSSNGKKYVAEITTTPAAVTFGSMKELGGTWLGSGKADSPYLIGNAADLTKLKNMVNQKGLSFRGIYFKMTGDITLPDDWVPIGATKTGQKYSGQGANVWPFSGIFDGGDHLLTVPEGGLPLLGYVRGAQVKNLNIYGSKIAGYGLVNNYGVDYGATGDYSDYTKNASYPYMPLTIEVDNVTLKSGTQTLKSGFIGGYASGANTINLFGCTVEKNVVIGYDKDQTGIGSFAGDLNGTLMNCVSYADVYGVGAVGGLVGMKGQSMGNASVLDSAFHGTVTATGYYAGGIIGSGYNVTSAPNTPCVTIQNCWSDGTIIGADDVGGLLGGEPVVKQCWANGIGYLQNNYFRGKVAATAAGAKNVGGIVGYMNTLDRYNIIGNNYYLNSCGADRGIGAVGEVDASTSTYGRTDDPTGAGALALCRSATDVQFDQGAVLAALNSGVNSSKWVQTDAGPAVDPAKHLVYFTIYGYSKIFRGGDSFSPAGATVTAVYNDGTTASIDLSRVTFTGFDSSAKKYCTMTATYDKHAVVFDVQVVSSASDEVNSAKNTVSSASYTYAMADANTSGAVKSLVEKTIGGLDLNGVSATVTLNSFSAATSNTPGQFGATVSLSKGTSRGTAAISGTITAAGTPTESGSTGNTVQVTFRLVGSTLSSGDVDLSTNSYKSAGYVTWIKTESYTLPKDSTMYDLFTQALSDAGLNSTGAGSNYVKTISAPSACGGYALSEFTNGQYSGWMYTVNGSHPDVGLKDYVLPDNATVVWHYVNDYRYEVADWVADADHPKLGNGTYYSLWLKAADTNPVCSAGTSAAK